MKALPKVSVIIPAYNSEKYIKEAIFSALTQDYSNMEIIVVDDGSTDNTAEIVRLIENVTLIQTINQGAGAARNVGIKESTGDYIAFLDADDIWLPGKIKSQVDFLMDTSYGLVCTNLTYWHPNTTPTKTSVKVLEYQSGWIMDSLMESCEMWTSAVMVKRSVIDQVGFFDESLIIGEDYDLWLRIANRIQCLVTDEIYAAYRIYDSSLTSRFMKTNHRLNVFLKMKKNPADYQSENYSIDQRKVSKKLSKIASDYSYECRAHCEFLHGFKSAFLSLWYNCINLVAYKEICYNAIARKS